MLLLTFVTLNSRSRCRGSVLQSSSPLARSAVKCCGSRGPFSTIVPLPQRIALPDVPTPTSPALSDHFYPRAGHIAAAVLGMFGRECPQSLFDVPEGRRLDQPDPSFTGPF